MKLFSFFSRVANKSFFYGNKEKEKKSFYYWLNQHINNNEYILLTQGSVFYKLIFKLPITLGDLPEIKEMDSKEILETLPVFIIKDKTNSDLPFVLDNHWHKISDGFFFELYENKKRFGNKPLPLRFGLLRKEKQQAIKLARFTLQKFLKEGLFLENEIFNYFDLSPRFFLTTSLDVSIWVGGKFRGSRVVENAPLWKSIINATIAASQDYRFKFLAYEDLGNTRIEICLMFDLFLPFQTEFIKKNKLIAENGCKLTVNGKVGWFLPEIFNKIRFKDLYQFLGALSLKIGLAEDAWRNSESIIEVFNVEDFIENEKQIGVINLSGPVLTPDANLEKDKLIERMRLAADWLANIQEKDGNFSPVIDPLSGSQTQIDWPRACLTGWSLIECGSALKDEKYIYSGKLHFDYFASCFNRNLFLADQHSVNPFLPLIFIYAGQEAIALYKMFKKLSSYYQMAMRLADDLFSKFNKQYFDSITLQQAANFCAEMSFFDKKYLNTGILYADLAKEKFEKSLSLKTSMNLAEQAELVNVFNKLYKLIGNSEYRNFSHRVADWLLSYQFNSYTGAFGSFKASTKSNLAYTRSTGKVFEALSGLTEYQESAKKALVWLVTMQYTGENTFFVPKEIQSKIIGGFRHDYFNQEAWIDSAGHFLLGTSRILNLWK